MGQKIFIPITDELLFDRPELIRTPLRPFAEELPCFRWLEVSIEEKEDFKAVSGADEEVCVVA